jgi:hypothetical protein
MRNAILCAAGISLAIVTADQVLAGASLVAATASTTVDRTLKADRVVPTPRTVAGAQRILKPAGSVTVTPAPSGARRSPALDARIPEGCEPAVSPLAKAAGRLPASRCLS